MSKRSHGDHRASCPRVATADAQSLTVATVRRAAATSVDAVKQAADHQGEDDDGEQVVVHRDRRETVDAQIGWYERLNIVYHLKIVRGFTVVDIGLCFVALPLTR